MPKIVSDLRERLYNPAAEWSCPKILMKNSDKNVDVSLKCTAHKMFFHKDFFSKYDLRKRKLRIQLHLLKKSLMENFIFCVVILAELISVTFYLHKQHESLRPQSLQPLQNRKQLQIQRPLHSILIAPLAPIHFKIYMRKQHIQGLSLQISY